MANQSKAIVRVPVTDDNFYYHWLLFLSPLHHLSSKEIEIVSCILKHQVKYSKIANNEEILRMMMNSHDVKRKIAEECKINKGHFHVQLSNLRKKRIIENGLLNPKFIPNIAENTNQFELVILFDKK